MSQKKGALPLVPLLVIFFVVGLIYAWATITANYKAFNKQIGEKQYQLINTYQSGETTLFYIDQSAKYSAYQAILDLAEKGGFEDEGKCGNYFGFNLWSSEGQISEKCIPDYFGGFKNNFRQKLSDYIRNYNHESYVKIPLDNYKQIDIADEIAGTADSDLIIKIGQFGDILQEETPIYAPSNTEIDAYLKKINSPLTGLGQCMKDAEKRTSVPASVILGVALHESRQGNSGLAVGFCPAERNPQNKKSYNLFGYKGKGPAGSCKWETLECLNSEQRKDFDIIGCSGKCSDGKDKCRVWADFKSYNDHCESINDFANLISRSDRYKIAMQYKDDPIIMVHKIKDGGYATDTNWPMGVNNIIRVAQSEIAAITGAASSPPIGMTQNFYGLYSIRPNFKVKVDYDFKEYNKIFEEAESLNSCKNKPKIRECIKEEIKNKNGWELACGTVNENFFYDFIEKYKGCLDSEEKDKICEFSLEKGPKNQQYFIRIHISELETKFEFIRGKEKLEETFKKFLALTNEIDGNKPNKKLISNIDAFINFDENGNPILKLNPIDENKNALSPIFTENRVSIYKYANGDNAIIDGFLYNTLKASRKIFTPEATTFRFCVKSRKKLYAYDEEAQSLGLKNVVYKFALKFPEKRIQEINFDDARIVISTQCNIAKEEILELSQKLRDGFAAEGAEVIFPVKSEQCQEFEKLELLKNYIDGEKTNVFFFIMADGKISGGHIGYMSQSAEGKRLSDKVLDRVDIVGGSGSILQASSNEIELLSVTELATKISFPQESITEESRRKEYADAIISGTSDYFFNSNSK